MTKSGTGTWDLGREDSGTPGRKTRGRGGAETRGQGDQGTRGRRDVGRGDAGTWDVGRGTLGRDKQTTPEVCAEFAIYSFRWLNRSLSENSSRDGGAFNSNNFFKFFIVM